MCERASLVCPVCREPMAIWRPDGESDLELDHCQTCGGMWFDKGEAAALRRCHPQTVLASVAPQTDAEWMNCHQCDKRLRRSWSRCLSCKWENRLQCPTGDHRLTRIRFDGKTLDVCQSCWGVWFDNNELTVIWNRTATQLNAGMCAKRADADGSLAFDLLLLGHDPGIAAGAAHMGASAAASVIEIGAATAGEAVGVIGDVAGAAFETTGELAGGVFEAIAEILSGLFDV